MTALDLKFDGLGYEATWGQFQPSQSYGLNVDSDIDGTTERTSTTGHRMSVITAHVRETSFH